MKSKIVAFILLSFVSCQGNKAKSFNELKKQKKNEQEISNPGEYFAKTIIETNLGKKSIQPFDLENPNYIQLFRKKGLTKVVAYYDKTTNRLNQLIKFEDALLFVASYDNSKNAKSAFERIKLDAELSNSTEDMKVDQTLSKRINLLRIGDKYGGLITYNRNQVFSLVENCEKLPVGKNWLEIEYTFTDLLKNENKYVEVLKAGCEEGKYYGGRRKASS